METWARSYVNKIEFSNIYIIWIITYNNFINNLNYVIFIIFQLASNILCYINNKVK